MDTSMIITGHGHQKCDDLHSWGPGIRKNYMIHYIVKGAGFLETEGKKYRIEEGMSFLTYPGKVIHYYPDEEDPWEYRWVDFVGEEIPQLLERTAFGRKKHVCQNSQNGAPLFYFRRLEELEIYGNNQQEAAGILLAILGFYADIFPKERTDRMNQKDNRLANALVLIHANYHKSDFHISVLCEMTGINRVTLYRLFTASVFCSPNEYLLRYRLEQAKKLLEEGFSVKQTAVSCGFADPFYFSRVFKMHEKVAPSEYARETE